MTAMRAGRLTNVWPRGGKTNGSGRPWVISARRDVDEVNGDGAHHDVSGTFPSGHTLTPITKMALPAGDWMIIETLTFEAGLPIATDRRVICRMGLKSKSDSSSVDYAADPTRVAPLVMSLARKTQG